MSQGLKPPFLPWVVMPGLKSGPISKTKAHLRGEMRANPRAKWWQQAALLV
jgi:hypothetical protein